MVRKGVFYTMKYGEMIPGRFCTRPNRFVAHVELKGQEEICHVKNTGRCRELLLPGARGWCRFDGNPERKTHYDLIAVEKAGRLINMDSQAPNQTRRGSAVGRNRHRIPTGRRFRSDPVGG